MGNGKLRIALVAVILAAVAAAAQDADDKADGPGPIRLVSRVFTPTEAIDPALEEYLSSLPEDDDDVVHVILQFRESPGARARDELAARGVRLLDTVPERAYLASVPADLNGLQGMVADRPALIHFVGLYAATDKLSPAFGKSAHPEIPAYTASRGGHTDILVQFFGDVEVPDQERELARLGVTTRERYRGLNGWRILIRNDQIRMLANSDLVKWLQPGPPGPEDDNDGARSQSGLGSDGLYPEEPPLPDDYNLTGEGVVVAQVETLNTSTGHLDLVDRVDIGDSTTPVIPLYSRTHMHDETTPEDAEYDDGEVVYIDIDDSRSVTAGDWRATAGAAALTVGEVAIGDAQIGTKLVEFYRFPDLYESFADDPSPRNYYYEMGEGIYRDLDRSSPPGGGKVSDQDVRLIDVTVGTTMYAAGSIVNGCGDDATPDCVPDLDVGNLLMLFPFEPHKHATHVAGTLAGDGTASNSHKLTGLPCDETTPAEQCNGGTERQWQGLAPLAKLYSLRIKNFETLLNAGCTGGIGGSCNDGLKDDYPGAIDAGVTISSNSWGWPRDLYCDFQFLISDEPRCAATPEYDIFAAFYDALVSGRRSDGTAACYDRELLIVTSSGNEGYKQKWRTARMTNGAKNTLNVGNVASDTNELRFDSGRGPTIDGRIKPDVVGPGYQTADEFPTEPWEEPWDGGIHSSRPFNQYYTEFGTSMSTPAISGTAALLTQWYRRVCDEQEPTPTILKAAIIHSAQDLTTIPNVSGDFPHADYGFGFGLPKARDAVNVITRHIRGEVTLAKPVSTYNLELGASTDLKVTLTWADPAWFPGVLHSEEHGFLHNDLDLALVYKPDTPDEYTYLPWTPDPDDELAAAKRVVDSRNTVEQVHVKNAQSGHWQVRISSSQLSQPPQDFVLVGEMLPAELSSCVDLTRAVREDIWAMDHADDDGTVPTSGSVWMSEDIWNHVAGANLGAHQNPVAGRSNRLYLRARNRGGATAFAASADVWVAPAGVGISWPASFEYIGRINVPSLATGAAPRQIGPLVWIPQRPKLASDYSFYVQLSSPGDPIPADVESGSLYQNVTKSNNLIWRNVHLVEMQRATAMAPEGAASGPWSGYAEFMMRNPNNGQEEVSIEANVGRSAFDQGLGVIVEFDAKDLRGVDRLRMQMVGLAEVAAPRTGGLRPEVRRFKLTTRSIKVEQLAMNPGESVPVRLFFSSPARLTAIHEFTIQQRIRSKLTGGITYRLKMAN